MLKQKTLKGSFTLNGKGLHTGVKLTVTFNPAPEHHGYKIQRIDLEERGKSKYRRACHGCPLCSRYR